MINPKCQNSNRQFIAINYQGYVVPCCLFLDPRYFQEIKNLLDSDLKQLHFSNGSIDDIIKSKAAEKIRSSFQSNPMSICKMFCSSKINHDTTPANGRFFNIERKK